VKNDDLNFALFQSTSDFFPTQGQQLGPLELQISTLQKQVEASNNSIIELQQFWLRNQSELVKTVQRVGQQSEEIKSLKKQYTILLHKKQRTEGKALEIHS
jgi:hypothetical protein